MDKVFVCMSELMPWVRSVVFAQDEATAIYKFRTGMRKLYGAPIGAVSVVFCSSVPNENEVLIDGVIVKLEE